MTDNDALAPWEEDLLKKIGRTDNYGSEGRGAAWSLYIKGFVDCETWDPGEGKHVFEYRINTRGRQFLERLNNSRRDNQIGDDGLTNSQDQPNADKLYDAEHSILVTEISLDIKKYLAKHPEKLYQLSPRKFEELIADILKDFGMDTELTKATRDGGRDIYAYVRNAVTSFLIFVECKRYAPDNRVGIDIVQRMYGTTLAGGAHKGMIVTTSFFTAPAIQEAGKISSEMELKDYNHLKLWLNTYTNPPRA